MHLRSSIRRRDSLLVLAMIALLVLFGACGSGTATPPDDSAAQTSGDRFPTPKPEVTIAETDTASDEPSADGPAPTVTPEPEPTEIPTIADPRDVVANRLGVRIISERPHSEENFTQGLLIDNDGRMFESTGSYGPSSTRLIELDPLTGETIRSKEIEGDVFGEGLALVGDRFVQLTWTSGIAFIWDRETFDKLGEFRYDTAGWGLCYDEPRDRLVMSDGSDKLVFRDPQTFAPLGEITVFLDGSELRNLNELECVGDRVWANVFTTGTIVEIDIASGAVVTAVDALGLRPDTAFDSNAFLNGIAYEESTGSFLITGKLWDVMYEVEFVSP